jgi:hypothetical protein
MGTKANGKNAYEGGTTLNSLGVEPQLLCGWGSFFFRHRSAAKISLASANSTDRHLPASGLAQFGMSIRLSRRRGTGHVRSLSYEAAQLAASFVSTGSASGSARSACLLDFRDISTATVSTTGVTGCFALATVRFAALATLRALPRLAVFPFGSFPRFCTFARFLPLAMIRPRSGWCSATYDVGSKEARPSPDNPLKELSTDRSGPATDRQSSKA